MSLLDKAVDQLAARVDDKVPGWLASGIVRARIHLDEHPTVPLVLAEGVELDVDAVARSVVDAVEEEEAGLAEFGRARFVDAIALTGLGRKQDARFRWLTHAATFEERRRASASADQRAEALADRREAAWDAFERFVQRVVEKAGPIALDIALRLLLGAL